MKLVLGFGLAVLVVFSGLDTAASLAVANWAYADAQSQIASQLLADNMHRMR